MISAILSWLKGAIIPGAMAATLLGPVDYRAINGVTGALSYAPTTGAFHSIGVRQSLSNGGTACSRLNTGTISGGTVPLLNGTNVWTGQQSVHADHAVPISTSTFTPDGSANNYALTPAPCELLLHAREPLGHTGRRHWRTDHDGETIGHRLRHDLHLGIRERRASYNTADCRLPCRLARTRWTYCPTTCVTRRTSSFP